MCRGLCVCEQSVKLVFCSSNILPAQFILLTQRTDVHTHTHFLLSVHLAAVSSASHSPSFTPAFAIHPAAACSQSQPDPQRDSHFVNRLSFLSVLMVSVCAIVLLINTMPHTCPEDQYVLMTFHLQYYISAAVIFINNESRLSAPPESLHLQNSSSPHQPPHIFLTSCI